MYNFIDQDFDVTVGEVTGVQITTGTKYVSDKIGLSFNFAFIDFYGLSLFFSSKLNVRNKEKKFIFMNFFSQEKLDIAV